ncbi:Hypothetical protein A7982_05464 [Minicystis rosea]|nr:Hypothetical protein A7982_05464 [Minicystis rosea]
MNRFATILFLALVPACSSSSTPSPDDPAAVAEALTGDWRGSCFDAGNGQHAQLTFHIEAARWAVEYVVHGDATCTAPLGDLHIAGPYEIVGASTKVAGASEGIFSFDERTITPKAQGFADYLGTLEGCGTGAWKVDTAVDILEGGCAPLGSYPNATCHADYDVVKVSEAGIQFGQRPADNNMCTADKRPTALSADVLHRL